VLVIIDHDAAGNSIRRDRKYSFYLPQKYFNMFCGLFLAFDKGSFNPQPSGNIMHVITHHAPPLFPFF
jgi:hypothetical protein